MIFKHYSELRCLTNAKKRIDYHYAYFHRIKDFERLEKNLKYTEMLSDYYENI